MKREEFNVNLRAFKMVSTKSNKKSGDFS